MLALFSSCINQNQAVRGEKVAEKRMFTKKITDSDAFLDMPMSTQCLYFHLNMNADDDGFVNNPKKIQRMIGASDDDVRILLSKSFILCFDNGVIVIKHWRMHNTLRKDRYKATTYQEEFNTLGLKENGTYTWQPNGNQVATQYRLEENSLDKDSKDKNNKHKYGEYKNVLLSDEDMEKLKNEFPTDYEERIERLSSYMASKGTSYKNHLATIRNWARKETPQTKNREYTEFWE